MVNAFNHWKPRRSYRQHPTVAVTALIWWLAVNMICGRREAFTKWTGCPGLPQCDGGGEGRGGEWILEYMSLGRQLQVWSSLCWKNWLNVPRPSTANTTVRYDYAAPPLDRTIHTFAQFHVRAEMEPLLYFPVGGELMCSEMIYWCYGVH